MALLAGVGAFHAYSPLLAVVVLSGILKAAFSAVTIASMIATVRGTATILTHARRAGCAAASRVDAIKENCFRVMERIFQRASAILRLPAHIVRPRWISAFTLDTRRLAVEANQDQLRYVA